MTSENRGKVSVWKIALATVLGIASAIYILIRLNGGTPGIVCGEFHDAVLFKQALEADPGKSGRDDKEIWEHASGATIQAKTFGRAVGRSTVWLDGDMLAAADGFGQFRTELAPGKYSLTGKCDGYSPLELRIKVRSGRKTYVNFILEPDE